MTAMAKDAFTPIADLGIIGDQRSAALVDRAGRIVWYCPGRFDEPSLLAALLDPDAGDWSVQITDAVVTGRGYVGRSGILETHFTAGQQRVTLTDFMPMGPMSPAGVICRTVSPSPAGLRLAITPRPGYGAKPTALRQRAGVVLIDDEHRMHASHPVRIGHDSGTLTMEVPAHEACWMVLASRDLVAPDHDQVAQWRDSSLTAWDVLNGTDSNDGPYGNAIAASLRAIRLLTFAETGGVVAAVTTSLPEVIGGARNYDYRYVWLRDAGMVASALARAGTPGEGTRFLEFLSSTHGKLSNGTQPLAPLISVAGEEAPRETMLMLRGYRDSRPVRIGNGANAQLQLDAYGNLLFAAQAVFNRCGRIPQWPVIQTAANFLALHWRDAEAGIWEENADLQHMSSKAIVASGLQAMAAHAPDPGVASHWLRAVADIRRYVADACMTPSGAYASVAGSDAVDITAALLPFWGFDSPDSNAMVTTMAELDRDYGQDGILYRRRLETDDSQREGYFLAGTLWAAKYWIAAGDLERGRRIIDAVLAQANDLGFLPEEIDPATGHMLGNFPQIFVHSALIGAILDLEGRS